MKAWTIVAQLYAIFVRGWNYRNWDPPYPGDGI